ncbi:MAG: tRNA (cytidine(34)-2'-O)-methyltransferase [Phycisphaerales bacterium]
MPDHASQSDQSAPSADEPRLRRDFYWPSPRLNIVLVEPEIPNNTGNIGRTCVTTGCRLHLVHPLAFDIDEKACRRAGLDYWPRLDLREHESAAAYLRAHPLGGTPPAEGVGPQPARTWLLTTRATRTIFDAPISMGDHLVFGRESAGLGDELLNASDEDQRLCVPLVPGERSLNLSTCVAVCVYESLRKMIQSGQAVINRDGRLVPPP